MNKFAINELKKQYGFKSVSALISEAVKNYKKQKRIEKWKKSNAEILKNPHWIQDFLFDFIYKTNRRKWTS